MSLVVDYPDFAKMCSCKGGCNLNHRVIIELKANGALDEQYIVVKKDCIGHRHTSPIARRRLRSGQTT